MEKLLTLTAQILLIHVTWTLVAAYPNLATQTTFQSTTVEKSDGTTLASSLAVDGNRNKNGSKTPYCAQTSLKNQSWWKVQLELSSHVNEIRIWLRNDSWGARQPRDYDIYLSDSGTCGIGTRCVRQNPIDDEMTVACAGVGEWVVICGYTYREMRICLCEVEIYGCPKAKYGNECLHQCGKCLDSSCNLANGYCPGECKANYWSDRCIEECSDKCSDQICRQSDGMCYGCVSGYWGDTCSHTCSDQCDEQGCMQFSGICVDCGDGHWGDNCSKNCSNGCNISCTQYGGVCLGCKSGYWNNTCDTKCGQCSKTACVQNNGRCVSECKTGYVFPKCICSIHCYNEVCNEGTQFCTNGCKAGYFGLTCSNKCNSKCLNGVCHRETGSCSNGCSDTYWGENCSKSCLNCRKNVCEQNNGMCLHGCVDDGFWGTHCKPCPDKCADTTCDQTTGQCNGCMPAYWTHDCSESCSSNCRETFCNQHDSSCINGCAMGYTGDTCMQVVAEEKSGVDIVSGAVGVVIGALAVIMVMLMFLLRRHLHRQNKPNATANITNTTEGIGETDMYCNLSSNRDVNGYEISKEAVYHLPGSQQVVIDEEFRISPSQK